MFKENHSQLQCSEDVERVVQQHMAMFLWKEKGWERVALIALSGKRSSAVWSWESGCSGVTLLFSLALYISPLHSSRFHLMRYFLLSLLSVSAPLALSVLPDDWIACPGSLSPGQALLKNSIALVWHERVKLLLQRSVRETLLTSPLDYSLFIRSDSTENLPVVPLHNSKALHNHCSFLHNASILKES